MLILVERIAIFYRIAGQSLLKYRPLSSYQRQSRLETIFVETDRVLLTKWNRALTFEALSPQNVLQQWLGFRLDSGGSIQRFLQDTCRINPDIAGLLISGGVFPNPLSYPRHAERWSSARPIDIARGFLHGDLNTNNILAKFSEDNTSLEGYYLIDFALFKDQMPLFYDQRYLEMSYLVQASSQVSFGKRVDFLTSVRTDLLLALSSDNAADAESLYQVAVDTAREAGDKMVELRAALRLSRLWQNQSKSEQAGELLGAAYSKITEGFTTADMKEAKALLVTLRS